MAISDDAIESFIDQNPELQNKELVHFSGGLVTDKAIGLHPLMTFGEELYELEFYQKIPFITEAESSDVLTELPNPRFSISKKDKPLYHSLCVMSGNYTSMLWNKLFKDFEEKFELPKEVAQLYMEQVFQNIKNQGQKSLTGPLVRGDEKTILSHLRALQTDPYLSVYEGFVQAHKNEEIQREHT